MAAQRLDAQPRQLARERVANYDSLWRGLASAAAFELDDIAPTTSPAPNGPRNRLEVVRVQLNNNPITDSSIKMLDGVAIPLVAISDSALSDVT